MALTALRYLGLVVSLDEIDSHPVNDQSQPKGHVEKKT